MPPVVKALISGIVVLAASPAGSRAWSFDSDKPQGPPAGFSFARTGDGRAGRWEVVHETNAPTGSSVLAQLDTDETDYRFPLAIAPDVRLKNLRLGVKCKPVDGKVDQACGLVFCYK